MYSYCLNSMFESKHTLQL